MTPERIDRAKRAVISIVQTLLHNEPAITPTLIADKIGVAVKLNPEWEDLDLDLVSDELIRRYGLRDL